MTSPNPIPNALPPLPAYRSIRLLQPVIAIAHASLVIQRLSNSKTRPNIMIKPSQLEDRIRFFLGRFRAHIHRRFRNSRRSGHLRKLCSAFLLLHPPSSKIPQHLCKKAKEASDAATMFPKIKQAWWRIRNFVCKSTLRQTECPPVIPMPFLGAGKARPQDIKILFCLYR